MKINSFAIIKNRFVSLPRSDRGDTECTITLACMTVDSATLGAETFMSQSITEMVEKLTVMGQ